MTGKKNDVISEDLTNSAGEQAEVKIFNTPGVLDDEQATAAEAEAAQGSGAEDLSRDMGAIGVDMAGKILSTPFAVAAAFLGSHWELSKAEIDLMAPPAARVFTELFGRYASQYPDAYMLGFSLCVCIGTRASITIQQKNQSKKEVKEETPSAAEAFPVPDPAAV